MKITELNEGHRIYLSRLSFVPFHFVQCVVQNMLQQNGISCYKNYNTSTEMAVGICI